MDFLVTIIEFLPFLHFTQLYQESSYLVRIDRKDGQMDSNYRKPSLFIRNDAKKTYLRGVQSLQGFSNILT